MNGTPPRSKPLPSRPSQDIGYRNGGGPPNGYRNENGNQRGYGDPPPRMNGMTGGTQEPSRRAVLEGYRPDIMTGFEGERPRYNPVSPLLALGKRGN
jgi:hypothetical protein